MMVIKIRNLFSVIIITSVFFTNCSVVFTGIGAMDNAYSGLPMAIPHLKRLNVGKKLILTLKNGELIKGKFVGLGKLTPEKYKLLYNKFIDSNQKFKKFPKIGQKILLNTNSGDPFEFIFEGFDITFGPYPVSWFIMLHQNVGKDININYFNSINPEIDEIITEDIIQRLLAGKIIPILTSVKLKTSNDVSEIPLHDIREINSDIKKHSALYGFILGTTIDYFIIKLFRWITK